MRNDEIQATEISPISKQTEHLTGTIEALQSVVSTLTKRLGNVLSPELTAGVDAPGKTPRSPTSTLTEQIEGANTRLDEVVNGLHRLIGRLEV
jgi:hypothetical protein